MDWEAIAAVGETIGAIGVIASVLYLAYEVRSNTKVLRADSSKDAARGWSDFNQMLSSHPSRHVFLKAFDPTATLNSLSDEDKQALTLMVRSIVQLTESEFFQYRAGILEETVWSARIRTLKSLLIFSIMVSWWEIEKQLAIYTPEFIQCVENTDGERLTQESVWGAGDTGDM